MKYKSNPVIMFVSFIKQTIGIGLITCLLFAWIVGGLLLGLDKDALIVLIYIAVIMAVVIACYRVFFRQNICVEVTGSVIEFSRIGKKYLSFPYKSFVFSSFVSKYSYNLIPVSTSRYLRVFPKEGGKVKDYQCYNFSKKTFEEFMAYIRPLLLDSAQGEPNGEAVFAQGKFSGDVNFIQEKEVLQMPSTPRKHNLGAGKSLEFIINKQLLIKQYKKSFLSLLIPLCSLVLLLLILQIIADPVNFIDNIVTYSIFIGGVAVILIPIPVIMFGIPLAKIKKNTPETITLFNDRLQFDEKVFYLPEIKQIKATPPSYQGGGGILRRKMTISEEHKVSTFILGDTRDILPANIRKDKPKVFADYEVFCTELENMLMNEPGKFMLKLG